MEKLTLDLLDALKQDLLKGLGVFKVLLDLGNDGLSKLLLLLLLDLGLVADPGVKDALGLLDKLSALLELKGLSLQLGGFLEKS